MKLDQIFAGLKIRDGRRLRRVGAPAARGGGDERGGLLIDTHGGCVADPVLDLFTQVIGRAPDVPVLLEWDTQLPDWEVLWNEAQRIETARRQALARHAA